MVQASTGSECLGIRKHEDKYKNMGRREEGTESPGLKWQHSMTGVSPGPEGLRVPTGL